MTIEKYMAPGSGKLVSFNTHPTDYALLEEISDAEMREIIAVFERKRIDAYWEESMLPESKAGGYVCAFLSTEDQNTVYFKATYLSQAATNGTLRGPALMNHLRALPMERQRELVNEYKPTSLRDLKERFLHWKPVIAVDFNQMLDEADSVASFVEHIVMCLSKNEAPFLHPFRYFELLTVLWEKGLFVFPFNVTAWATPIKWSTLTNPRFGGPRSEPIKTVYTLPPGMRADIAWTHACTFFAVSNASSDKDLSPALIERFQEISWAWISERYPEEKNKKLHNTQRGRLRLVIKALYQHFNLANPELAVEYKRPPKAGVVDDERRTDGLFRWLATARPELKTWSEMFKAHIASLTTARTAAQIERLNIFGDYLCTLAEPPGAPWKVVRAKHIYDASLNNSNTFLEYLRENYDSPKRRNDTLSTIRRFFDWQHDYLVASGSADAESFKNPVFPSDSTGREDGSDSKTARDSLPPYVMKELRELLTENDFAFGRRYQNAKVHVFDNQTGQNTWVFDPSLTVCLYTLFDTPIRSHQARWLDSGLLDERIYDAKAKTDIPNPSVYALQGRREGVLRLEHDGLRANAWLSLWINTNKTATYESNKIGYVVPYVSNTLSSLLQMSIDWQKRYLHELRTPVAYLQYQKDVKERPRPTAVVGPTIAPLFRDPRSPDKVHPISYARLKRFYIKALAVTQSRIEKKYGHKLKLVESDGRGGLTWTVDLHSLRVSGITNLIEAGVPLEVVQQFVAGHATLVMTLHYLRYSPAKLRKFLEEAHERMLNDSDFVGSELFADSLEEFAPFMLGQEGAGNGAGMTALRDKTGIMTINSEGICPGTSCSTGGPLGNAAQNTYAPVPGGQRCGLCRYWLTGPAHLLGQVAAVNNLAYAIRKKGLEVANLNDQRIDAEDDNNQRKARELRDRVDILNRELEIDVNEWAARYRYAERSIALMNDYLATKAKVCGTDTSVPVPILTASNPSELKVTLEEAHEFALLDQITQMSEFTTGFKNREAELEKNTILSKMLTANGIQPFLLMLNEQQAHEAGNLLSALLLQQVRGHELDEVLTGKKPLASYPTLSKAIRLLQENSGPDSLTKSSDIDGLAVALGNAGGQLVEDDEGEEVFG
jgi:hypothetical protein